MPWPDLAIVRLKSDRFLQEGVEPGAIGVIVDVYNNDAYEVEFSDRDGITIALCTLGRDDLDLVAESPSIAATRSAD